MTDFENIAQWEKDNKILQENYLSFDKFLIKTHESNIGHLVICTHTNKRIFSKTGMGVRLLCTSRKGHKPVKCNLRFPMIPKYSTVTVTIKIFGGFFE